MTSTETPTNGPLFRFRALPGKLAIGLSALAHTMRHGSLPARTAGAHTDPVFSAAPDYGNAKQPTYRVAGLFALALLLGTAVSAAFNQAMAATPARRAAAAQNLRGAPPPPDILHADPDADTKANATASTDDGQSSTGAQGIVPASTPFQPRLAPPTPGRPDMLEAMTVTGQRDQFNLPGLGSTLHGSGSGKENAGRIKLTLLPTYTPRILQRRRQRALQTPGLQHVGFIQLFRLSFGDDSDE